MIISISFESVSSLFPDTGIGAITALRSVMNDRWFTRLDIDSCRVSKIVPGTWVLDCAEHTRITVYLPGYVDDRGVMRTAPDFEEGRS